MNRNVLDDFTDKYHLLLLDKIRIGELDLPVEVANSRHLYFREVNGVMRYFTPPLISDKFSEVIEQEVEALWILSQNS